MANAMLNVMSSYPKLLQAISPREAMRVTTTCREVLTVRKAVIGSAIFAGTRQHIDPTVVFPLSVWLQVWEACVLATQERGLSVRLWAESTHCRMILLTDSMPGGKGLVGCLTLPCTRAEIQRLWQVVKLDEGGVLDLDVEERVQCTEDVAFSLASVWTGQEATDGTCRMFFFAGLFLLSTGRFAWLSKVPNGDENARNAVVVLGSDLRCLLGIVSDMMHRPALCDQESKLLQELVWDDLQQGCYDDFLLSPVPADASAVVSLDQTCNRDLVVDEIEVDLEIALEDWPVQAPVVTPVLQTQYAAPVVQNVFHIEPAAMRDETLLNLQSDEQFAEDVERQLRSVPGIAAAEEAQVQPQICEPVNILRFGGGNTEDFRKRLMLGPELRSCCQELGHEWHHPSGALIFVNPEQLPEVLRQLANHELHPFHLVVAQSKEYLIDEVLASMPCRKRPKEKRGKRLSLSNDVGEEFHYDAYLPKDGDRVPCEMLIESRTFLCLAPQLREANTVNQSTTEACTDDLRSTESVYNHRRGTNPRRFDLSWACIQ